MNQPKTILTPAFPGDREVIDAVLKVAEVIIEAANDSPNGIPSGHLFAILNGGVGMSLDIYTWLIDLLVEAEKVTIRHDLIFGVKS